MKHSLLVALIGLTVAFAGVPTDTLSQSLVDSHVAASDFDISESSTCDLAEAQAPSGALACGDDVKYEIVPAVKGERSTRLLVAETVDAEQLFKEVAQNSQDKEYCVQPNNPTAAQVAAFEKCRDDLPDCDKRRWEEGGDGSLILICHCRWLFSSC